MNAHQRRKEWRRIERTTRSGSQHRLIRHWSDLAELPESETHRLEIDVEGCNGWLHRKDGKEFMGKYLSTHTFYGSNYKRSTIILRQCGFNVKCVNWDMPNAKGVAAPACTPESDPTASTESPRSACASSSESI